MSVLEGHNQLYVHYVKGPQQVNVIGEPGRLGPLHNTSMGKVLIAFAPRDVRAELRREPAAGPDRTQHDHRPGGVRRADRDRTPDRATPSPTRSTRPASGPSACPCSDRTATPWRPSRSPRPASGCPSRTASTSSRSSPRPPASSPCCCRPETTPPAERSSVRCRWGIIFREKVIGSPATRPGLLLVTTYPGRDGLRSTAQGGPAHTPNRCEFAEKGLCEPVTFVMLRRLLGGRG